MPSKKKNKTKRKQNKTKHVEKLSETQLQELKIKCRQKQKQQKRMRTCGANPQVQNYCSKFMSENNGNMEDMNDVMDSMKGIKGKKLNKMLRNFLTMSGDRGIQDALDCLPKVMKNDLQPKIESLQKVQKEKKSKEQSSDPHPKEQELKEDITLSEDERKIIQQERKSRKKLVKGFKSLYMQIPSLNSLQQ